MNRLLRPANQALWNILQKYGLQSIFCSTQPLMDRAARRKFGMTPSVKYKSHLCRMENLSTTPSRHISSTHVQSPGDMRSPIPDIDIPNVTFPEFFFKRTEQFKDKVAVSDHLTGRKYTYFELKEYTIRVASALYRQGFRKGDVITTFTINLPEFSICVLACACLGVIISPANPAYKPNELSHMLNHNKATAIFTIPQLIEVVLTAICDPDMSHKVKSVYTFGHAEPGACFFNDLMKDDGKAFPENVDLDPVRDVMVLPYSSGTTGMPKGVMLSHHNLVANVLQAREMLDVTAEDKNLGLLPMYHIYGLVSLQFNTMYEGAEIITVPRFEPELFLKTIQREKISILQLVPPIILFLAKHPMVDHYDLSSVRFLVSGSAPLSASLTMAVQKRLNRPVYQGYGLTETSPAVAIDAPPGHPGTIGYLVPNTRGKLVKIETDEPVSAGEWGELCVNGPQVMLGYYHNKQATDQVLSPDGWLHTGDLASMTEEGLVVIEDRLKEILKYKGFQVAPAELESVLLTHPAVQDAGVVGVPDELHGELPRAYVVLAPGKKASAKDICDFVKERVSSHKELRGGVEFLDEIPKNPSGKILRRVLKKKTLKTD